MTQNTATWNADNCLIVVLDTVRAKSTYLGENGLTPQLRKLASQGISFERAYTPAPWTLPSHASIFTGLYPTEHGATHQHKWLDSEHTTLPQLISAEGIRTGLFTANMFLTESFNMSRGFDEISFIRGDDNKLFAEGLDPIKFVNEREYEEGFKRFSEIARAILDGPIPKNVANALYYKLKYHIRRRFGVSEPPSWDRQATNEVQEFISDSVASSRRFFGVVNLIGAHGPWEFEREHLKAIDIDPGDFAARTRWEWVAENSAAQWPFAAGEVEFDETDQQILTHLYESWVHRVDELAGELIDCLEAEGIRENTAVIVTADHGECIARDGVLGHELTVDEDVAHVPLVMTGPSIPTTTVTEPVSLKDVHGTVLRVLGIDKGKSTIWDGERGGLAFTETYPVNPDSVSEQYRDVASKFGRRYALFTSHGWAERRELTGERFGDSETHSRLDDFLSDLAPHNPMSDAGEGTLPVEIEDRLEHLGYRS